MTSLIPKDHAEAVATFRHGVIGGLCTRGELDHGVLAEALRALATTRFRLPDAASTRTFSVPTLERWYYAYRAGGLPALQPQHRSDRGRGRQIDPDLLALLCDIRREHPAASVPLILRTLEADGRLDKGHVREGMLRRIYRQNGLDRVAQRDSTSPKTRLRWQAAMPDAIWHGDVCHGPTLVLQGIKTPLRIHGLLDDCSRFVVALEVHTTEREEDMLHLLVRALRRHGKPDALYLDNGSTYRGETLRVACARLGISLLHAKPYDPQARGKMERFWRTLREQCLDVLGPVGSLHDVHVRLLAWLDTHYHAAPHAGLLGQAPLRAYAPHARVVSPVDETALRDALTVRARRRVRRDTTVSVLGELFELEHGYLAGRIVTVAYSVLDEPLRPWVEIDDKTLPLHRVDTRSNAHRHRPSRRPGAEPAVRGVVPFDPPKALLDKALGRVSSLTEARDGLV